MKTACFTVPAFTLGFGYYRAESLLETAFLAILAYWSILRLNQALLCALPVFLVFETFTTFIKIFGIGHWQRELSPRDGNYEAFLSYWEVYWVLCCFYMISTVFLTIILVSLRDHVEGKNVADRLVKMVDKYGGFGDCKLTTVPSSARLSPNRSPSARSARSARSNKSRHRDEEEGENVSWSPVNV
eukprot:Trichotokara_eunicae@DN4984_c0_g1_i5.p1